MKFRVGQMVRIVRVASPSNPFRAGVKIGTVTTVTSELEPASGPAWEGARAVHCLDLIGRSGGQVAAPPEWLEPYYPPATVATYEEILSSLRTKESA